MIGVTKTAIALRKDRGQFQRPGPLVPDGTGWAQSWVDLLPPDFAHITPATQASLEHVTAGTVISEATHVVEIAYRADLTTKCRFLIDGRSLSVLDINDPDERHVELRLVCAEIVA